jgi:hypothetical protein
LDEEDVVRHRLVKAIIKAYNKDDERIDRWKKKAREKADRPVARKELTRL